MNILVISPSYFPIKGGTEQVIYELVSRLKQDNTIIILTIKWKKDMKPNEVIDGVEVHRTRFIDARFFCQLSKYLSLFLAVIKLNKKIRFSLIHQFHVYETGGAVYLCKKFLKIPFITTLAGWDTYDPYRKIPQRYLPIIRTVLKESQYVTAPSHFQATEGTKQGYKKEIIVIPHGSNMHDKVALKHSDISSTFSIQNKKIILSVQRLHERKGLKYLFNAIPKIIKTQSDIVFIIVGKGPEELHLKELVQKLSIQDHVLFAGFIDDSQLPAYYSSADLFVLPTIYEAFGLVYVDALCFGVPIVSTENAGALDIVSNENGILVPIKSSQKLAEAIKKALDKKWDKEAIKADAEKYRWENIVDRYDDIYKKVIKGK